MLNQTEFPGITTMLEETIPGVCWNVEKISHREDSYILKGLWPDGGWDFAFLNITNYPGMQILTAAISLNNKWLEGGH